ncbi:MAG: hypothetical protein KA444_01020 [Bacteroidia bacterium]|nr:hypothetical protein [Bacteroidia bacterium]
MIQKLILLFAIFLLSKQAFAQDTLIMFNGRIIPAASVEFQEDKIRYQKLCTENPSKPADNQGSQDGKQDKKKVKLKSMDAERVFSIKYRDGSERVLYTPDTTGLLEFNIEEMRLFILGEQDATKYYKNNLNKGIGFGLGAAAGFLGFYGIAVPPLYATIMGSFTPNLDKKLRKQNAMRDTKMVLDNMSKPSPPVAKSNDPLTDTEYQSALKVYEVALKDYNTASANYNKAAKDHSRHIYFSDTELLKRNEYREGYERKARDRKIRNAMLSGLAGFTIVAIALPLIY